MPTTAATGSATMGMVRRRKGPRRRDDAPPLDRSLLRGLWASHLIGLGYAPSSLMGFLRVQKSQFYADIQKAKDALNRTAAELARRDAEARPPSDDFDAAGRP